MSLQEKLIKSAKAGNSREVRKLLGRGVQITKDKFGNTALHEAAWNGHSDVVKLLLNAFCFVDSINNSGFTPLHLASQNGHGKAVKTLLKWRADPSLLNQHGETALHLAAKYNHSTVISVFASFRINLNIRGKDSNTALHIAAKLGNTEALKALLRGGANPHLLNVRRARPLDYAEISGFKPAIKLLSSKSKMRTRSLPDAKSRTPTPTDNESTGGLGDRLTPPLPSPRLHRANSASARINLRLSSKKEKGLTSKLASNVQMAISVHESSPPNPYEELDELNGGPPRGPTIDQLLTEIEQECHGPDYKYSPQGGRGPSAEILDSPRDVATSLSNDRAQLFQGTPFHSKAASFDGNIQRRISLDSSIDSLPLNERRAVENAVERTFQAYETIPFRLPPSSDDDTYVYMAPYRDAQTSSPQLSQSSQDSNTPNSEQRPKMLKRAVICSSPVVPEQRHEPNVSLTPTKSILSQPSSLQQSEIDRYLQEELETMQRAFQIRLTQLEKRYQRQLRMEQKRNLASGAAEAVPINVQLRAQRKGSSRHRRSSWHSCMSDSDTEEPAQHQLQRCGSTQGFDSDCSMGESDHDATTLSEDDNHTSGRTFGASQGYSKLVQRSQSLGVTPLGAMGGGLKGSAKMWNMEPGNGARAGPPQLSVEDTLEEAATLPRSAKALVNERVSEHRAKILLYFQQVSEAKIAAIERQYETHIGEVEKRYQSQAKEKLTRLETRVKDLEKMLDVQTLV